MFNAANLSPQGLIAQVSNGLVVIRAGMDIADDLYAWSSGVSAGDLTSLGPNPMSSGDANAILSAIADAHALAGLYNTGLPPGTYPQPPSAYVYGASQRIVMGPRPT